jgi:predicted dehydrogenase
MAYTNPRALPIADIGPTLVTLCACTLADYTSGGTQTPVVGDVVTFSTTGDWYAKRAGDELNQLVGRVTKIEVAPTGGALGYIGVEWLDVVRFVAFPCTVLANVTRGNQVEKAGADTVAADWDAPDALSTAKIVVVAKSAASGAGTFVGAVFA